MKIIFTWWNKQTFGTFLKTFFTGINVGKDELGNKYYKNKKGERWVVYSNDVPINKKKFNWQKTHKENKTGTSESFKPTKIKKDTTKKYETWK